MSGHAIISMYNYFTNLDFHEIFSKFPLRNWGEVEFEPDLYFSAPTYQIPSYRVSTKQPNNQTVCTIQGTKVFHRRNANLMSWLTPDPGGPWGISLFVGLLGPRRPALEVSLLSNGFFRNHCSKGRKGFKSTNSRGLFGFNGRLLDFQGQL